MLSMTGFGSANGQFEGREFRIDIKAINSKMGDMRFRLPIRYSPLELRMRRFILDRAHRGKFDVTLSAKSLSGDDDYKIDLPLFQTYYEDLQQLLAQIGVTDSSLASGILKIQNVVRANEAEISAQEEQVIFDCLTEALNQIFAFRLAEGTMMAEEFEKGCRQIESKIGLLEPLEGQRFERMREKLKKSFEEINHEIEIDKNRFEQELVYYIEKLDVTEEKVRLQQHCAYFLQTLKEEKPVKGKTLAFITQEMGREINTIGSKANDHRIQHIVVEMKEELEKIKEQLANVV